LQPIIGAEACDFPLPRWFQPPRATPYVIRRRTTMSDQAQGLRALADQIRGEHTLPAGQPYSPSAEPPSSLTLAPTRPSIEVPAERVLPDLAVADARLHSPRPAKIPHPAGRILAVTSGKGGVGKSNFSTNLAITLGQ